MCSDWSMHQRGMCCVSLCMVHLVMTGEHKKYKMNCLKLLVFATVVVVAFLRMAPCFSSVRHNELNKDGSLRREHKKRKAEENASEKVSKKMREDELARDRKAKSRRRNEEKLKKKLQNLYQAKYCDEQQKADAIENFERKSKEIHHHHCQTCDCVGISLSMSSEARCKWCQKNKLDKNIYLREKLAPVWYECVEDRISCSNAHYELPTELTDMTEAEKMLIQKYSVYVPLHHIQKGVLGFKGHVCCFPQKVEKVFNVLPRLPKDVNMVKLIKTVKDKDGEMKTKLLKVRKEKVLSALTWLVEHNVEYGDIVIDENNLDWMGNDEERELPPTIEYSDKSEVRCLFVFCGTPNFI